MTENNACNKHFGKNNAPKFKNVAHPPEIHPAPIAATTHCVRFMPFVWFARIETADSIKNTYLDPLLLCSLSRKLGLFQLFSISLKCCEMRKM